jgi:hypothetical protein
MYVHVQNAVMNLFLALLSRDGLRTVTLFQKKIYALHKPATVQMSDSPTWKDRLLWLRDTINRAFRNQIWMFLREPSVCKNNKK